VSLFLTIALVHLIALLSPGPDFFFVSQLAVSRSRREALYGVVGITLGVVFWSSLALLGLQWLLHQVSWLERAIAVCGGIYLGWMGLQMLRGAIKPAVAHASTATLTASPGAALRKGLLTNLANPKAAVYFASIFSAFLNDGVSASSRWGLWLMVAVETMVWFTFVAGVFALPAMRRGYLRASRWIDGCAGAVFIAFGLHLVFARRAV
jgi:threonine efflux protein